MTKLENLLVVLICGLLLILFFWKLFLNAFLFIFVPKMKIIKGKIIRLKSKKFFVSSTSLLLEHSPVSSMSLPVTSMGYFVFLKEKDSGSKYFIEISSQSFKDLQEKKKSLEIKDEILFYFKKYFWGLSFDHFETKVSM